MRESKGEPPRSGGSHFGQRRFIEAVTANIIDQIIQRDDCFRVDHLDYMVGKRSAHVRNIAGCEASGPLGIEVGPGKGLDIDFYLGMICHELIRRSLNGLQPGTLGKRMPERDLALKLVGLGRLAGGGCLSVRGLGRGS